MSTNELERRPIAEVLTNFGRKHVAFLVFVLLSVFFWAYSDIDLIVTGYFWNSEEGFYLKNEGWVQAIYWTFNSKMPKIIIPAMLIAIALSYRFDWFSKKRKKTLFALFVLLLGPGLIVHTLFKDQWDRARPRHVVEFGGTKEFTPAWVIADQCEKNCSFVSGHAAMGFYWMILGYLLAKRRWFYIGMGIGVLVGFTRIIQGGHFFSDTVLAGFMVYWTIVFFAWLMKIPEPK